MRTLLVLRHGKSSWKHPQRADHDRPLSARGRRDAPRMGRLLRGEGLVPDLVISSTAVRARVTAELAAGEMRRGASVELKPRLHLAEPPAILDILRSVDEGVSKLLLVGHNPGLEALVVTLTGRVVDMPTAALAVVRIDTQSWSELTTTTPARLIGHWRPRELPAGA